AALTAGGIGNKSLGALVQGALVRLELARGNVAAARPHRDEALKLAGYKGAHAERALPRVLLDAGQLSLAEHDSAQATQFTKASLTITEGVARGPDTSADVGEGLLRLAQAQLAADPNADIRPLLLRAVRCLTNGLGADHALTREAGQLLA